MKDAFLGFVGAFLGAWALFSGVIMIMGIVASDIDLIIWAAPGLLVWTALSMAVNIGDL